MKVHHSNDGEKVGRIKEVRGQAFKVETGLLQKDYGLAGDSVAEAAPDAAVTLVADKNQIDSHKIEESEAA